MSNIIGNNIKLLVFGESHGPYIGASLDNVPAGIKIDYELIDNFLSKRRPSKKSDTKRCEKDEYQFISGVKDGYTTGSPLTVIIPNKDIDDTNYDKNRSLPRPSHADYTSLMKYHGFNDTRGGGHFSGRITASIVIIGAILYSALKDKGISINSHILKIGNVSDENYLNNQNIDLSNIDKHNYTTIKDLDEEINASIELAKENNDSIGGIIQTIITNLPVGLGEPMFDSLESSLSKALFGIGAIKGIEFGQGFNFANLTGKEANDEFYYDINGEVKTKTNNNGGINGGISNGMPVIFNCAVKPTPSISKAQNTINLETKQNDVILIEGRHDPSIVRRINIVIKAISSIIIFDNLLILKGYDYFCTK